jgi:hypothetical protein
MVKFKSLESSSSHMSLSVQNPLFKHCHDSKSKTGKYIHGKEKGMLSTAFVEPYIQRQLTLTLTTNIT